VRGPTTALKWFLRLAIAGGLLAYIFSRVPVDQVIEQFAAVRPGPLLAALLVTLLSRLVSALQFKRLTDVQQMNVSLGRIFYINTATAFYQLFLPGYISGGAIRWYKLAASLDNAEKALAVILVSRLFDTVVAVIWMLTLFAADTAFWAEGYSATGKFFGGALVAFSLSCLCLKYHQRLSEWLRRRLAGNVPNSRGKFIVRIRSLLQLLLGFDWLTVQHLVAHVTLLSLYHVLGALAWFCLAISLEIDVPFLAIIWIRIFIYLAMLVPISFSGLGVREGLLIVLLAAYGISSSSALALGLLLFGLSVAIGLLGGIVEALALSFGTAAGRSDKPAP
jgi:hypothetical protein